MRSTVPVPHTLPQPDRRRQRADRKQTTLEARTLQADADNVPLEAALHVQKDCPVTRTRYTKFATAPMEDYQFPKDADPAVLDAAINLALVVCYLDGDDMTHGRYLLYAVRWKWLLTSLQSPLSYASLEDYRKACQQRSQDLVSREATLHAAESPLFLDGGIVGGLTALAFLFPFDAYTLEAPLFYAIKVQVSALHPLVASLTNPSRWS